LSLLEEAATKLAPFLGEIVFVGGVTLGLLITDKAAAPNISPKQQEAFCVNLVFSMRFRDLFWIMAVCP
jgi:hypothetical protein